VYDAILVPTDGREAATAALGHAVRLAKRLGAVVHVLAVVDPSRNPLSFGVKEVDELNRAADALVTELVATYDEHDVELRGTVRRGRPYEEALAYADEIPIDLIVVGRERVEGAPMTVLGRTADRLARSAPIPVAIVPGPSDDENLD